MWNVLKHAAIIFFAVLTIQLRFASAWKQRKQIIGNRIRHELNVRGGSSNIEDTQLQSSPELTALALLENNNWRDELPDRLRERKGALHRFLIPTGVPLKNPSSNLNENICEVFVLGTAHISKDSCEDVKLLMKHVRPDALFIELCNQRMAILEDEVPVPIETENQEDDKKSVSQMTNEIMEVNPGMSKAAAMSSVLLSKIQGDYASSLNVTIGGEFKEAFNCAKSQQAQFLKLVEKIKLEHSQGPVSEATLELARDSNGCSVILGDRPVRLTLLRAWEALSFFGKIKLVIALAWSSLRQPSTEELREWIESIMNDPSNDILTKSVEELGRHFPAIKKTIIEERDVYMACKIVQTARIMGVGSSHDGVPRKIVAVVGAGHCPGITKLLLGEMKEQGSLDAEKELQQVVETKNHRVKNDPDMQTLITEVVSLQPTE